MRAGGLPERRLAFVDSSLDLYITPLLKPQPYKLSAMIDSIAWNEAADMLTCLGDGQCTTWLVPSAASTDSELCAAAKVTSDATLSTLLGPSPSILRAAGPRLCVLKADGSLLHITTSYYAPILYEAVAGGKWEAALRLARFVKHDALWSALAILALNARNLNAAEVALAAVKRVDKLEWVLKVKRLALPELQQAEMMVYKRQVEDAEGILLQATPPLVYRAIKLNVRLARWERALALALQHNVHVDTVLWYRRQYLASLHRPEHVEAYLKAAATVGDLNVDAIRSKKAAEKAKEATRAGASASAGAGGGAKPKPTAAASSDGKGSDDMPEHDL
ncbi:hypothetical protein EON62_03670 [archaeon]|nr:MAG: hypothetical protein EON62_03670 [archaeon]